MVQMLTKMMENGTIVYENVRNCYKFLKMLETLQILTKMLENITNSHETVKLANKTN